MSLFSCQLAQVASDVDKAIFFKNLYFTGVLNGFFNNLYVNQLEFLLLNS